MKPPRSRARAVYRVVEVRQWNDARLTALKPPPPNARFLHLYLQTAPATRAFPGLYVFSVAETAERFGWSVRATAAELGKLVDAGLVRWDAATRIVWLPDEIASNAPQSPNAAKAWAFAWSELPDCPIVRDAREKARAFLAELGEAFAQAFDQGLVQACPHPSRIQEQEQEQDLSLPAPAREAPPETEPADPSPPPAPPELVGAVRDELQRAGDLLEGADVAAAADRAAHALDAFAIRAASDARKIAIEAITYGRSVAAADRALDAIALLARIEQKIVWIAEKHGTAPPPRGGDRDRRSRGDDGDPAATLLADARESAKRADEEQARRARDAELARGRAARDAAPISAGSLFAVPRPDFGARRSA